MHSVKPCLIVFTDDDSWAEICSSQLVLIKKVLISPGVGDRLREERDRLGQNQTDFGTAAGVSRGTQKAYELETSSPDVRYLSALQSMGVDVHYVLTGSRLSPELGSLKAEESKLLEQFQSLSEKDQEAVSRLVSAMAATTKGPAA